MTRSVRNLLTGAALAALILRPGEAAAATGDDPAILIGYQTQAGVLTQISVRISPTGVVHYSFSGYHPNVPGLVLVGEGGYDPNTRRASERLSFPAGQVQTAGTCPADPWQNDVACTGGTYASRGPAPTEQAFQQYGVPVGARLLSVESRNKVQLAYMQERRSWTPTPTRTPLGVTRLFKNDEPDIVALRTPTPRGHVGKAATLASASGGTGHGAAAPPPPPPAAAPTPTPTHTPTPRPVAKPATTAPAYAALYAPGAPPLLVHVGQTFTIPVLVTNTSSQSWPAGGAFKLSYHWVVNGQVTDGAKTPLPGPAGPGASVNVGATVQAPLSNGRWTIRWDMFQDGVGFFSAKGVPVKEQPVTVSP